MKIVRCPECSESFPDYLFEFGIAFRCGCGRLVDPKTESLHLAEGSEPSGPRTASGAAATSPGASSSGSSSTATPPARTARDSLSDLRESPLSADPFGEQDRRARELRRRADRIGYLIISTDTPLRQIEHEMHTLRDRCRRYFPEIRGAYEQVYEARLQKLWREFRQD
jgi:hypothetical protein